jgi:hypothetical protein
VKSQKSKVKSQKDCWFGSILIRRLVRCQANGQLLGGEWGLAGKQKGQISPSAPCPASVAVWRIVRALMSLDNLNRECLRPLVERRISTVVKIILFYLHACQRVSCYGGQFSSRARLDPDPSSLGNLSLPPAKRPALTADTTTCVPRAIVRLGSANTRSRGALNRARVQFPESSPETSLPAFAGSGSLFR